MMAYKSGARTRMRIDSAGIEPGCRAVCGQPAVGRWFSYSCMWRVEIPHDYEEMVLRTRPNRRSRRWYSSKASKSSRRRKSGHRVGVK